MSTKSEHRAMPTESCELTGSGESADLTWLMHRAADTLGDVFDAVARDAGLVDLRDWLVLALAGDGTRRTQLEIATQLGIDKSTLGTIVDRLEKDGLVVRTASATDRRVRIPEATPAGVELHDRVAGARDAAIKDRLAGIPARDQAVFRSVLWTIATGVSVPA